MPILTPFDVEQKRVTQIIQISKMAALEQRSAIKFCVAIKKSRRETFKCLKAAFGNNTMKKTLCINSTVSLSKAILQLLMNQGQAAPHPSQQRKSKQSKSCWTLIVGWLLEILQLGLGIPSVRCLELFIMNWVWEDLCEVDATHDWWKSNEEKEAWYASNSYPSPWQRTVT